ncbi:MAG: serine/threonine protein kinase [Anaerolineae bacterium]|nr:serine/threonine protein kinase [Anaerolineae bacterium]
MVVSTDTLLNRRIGRYDIRERIGSGGMARVFKGVDKNLERLVAIKILHEHLAEEAGFKERFEREAKLVASLNHPNIVQVYDYDVTVENGHTVSYMVMPYIPGSTLRDVLHLHCEQGARMSRENILKIMHNLTDALGYAHARGMVHRDVKPANVMFGEQGQAVLTDFGIAKLAAASNLTQDGATVGTPAYLSPEQAAGLPVDSRSDLYALGIIVYEMLTGEPPFTGDSTISVVLKHIHEPIPDISTKLGRQEHELAAFIFKALAKHPDDRYQTAQAFAEDLRLALGGQAIHASISGQQYVTGEFPARSTTARQPILDDTETQTLTPPAPPRTVTPPLIIAGALLAVAALLIAVIALTGTSPAPETTISSMTAGEPMYFISSFDAGDPTAREWPQNAEGSTTREITPGGSYRFLNRSAGTAVTSLFNVAYSYDDATVMLDATLEADSPSSSGYGIVFRYVDERNYHVFAVDGMGRYSIWELRDAQWTELRLEKPANEEWTLNEAINPIGEVNRLSITFIGNRLMGYVNDVQVVDVTASADSPMSGAVGIYLAAPRSAGNAAVSVNTYGVTGDIPSMTG